MFPVSLQSALQVTLVTAAVRRVHSVSIVTGRVITSVDSVTVSQDSRGHCAMRVSITLQHIQRGYCSTLFPLCDKGCRVQPMWLVLRLILVTASCYHPRPSKKFHHVMRLSEHFPSQEIKAVQEAFLPEDSC